MSGHSKWSKVKHQKATTDKVKASAFTKASVGITIAVKLGGGVTDPNSNFRLRLAMDKARAVNMPRENIERAIAKAKGEGSGTLMEMMYEAYGPGGVALIIQAATDNPNRTVSNIKSLLERNGGRLVPPGAVAYLFERRGALMHPTSTVELSAVHKDGLDRVVELLEELEDVQTVYTNEHV